MKKVITLLSLLLMVIIGCSQKPTQTIRGIILDKDSKAPIKQASVLLDVYASKTITTTDSNGVFALPNIEVGRHSLEITMVGYQPLYLSDIQLNAGKEVVLTIELEERIVAMADVVVTAKKSTLKTVNDMVGISGRTFSINEANRFAGSQNDPSRMARNYAGVSGANDQRNDIIIRGNAPQGLLWRIEGIPVPNPNHFSGQGSTGGPISIINYKMLSNSDFITGAFPAEYGNATSGVFDIKIRNGNNKRTEKTIQIGALGLEALLEGPMGKDKKSSYLIGYRYSTLSILSKLNIKLGFASVPYYQDLSFKFNWVTKKAGTFKLFGIAGLSKTTFFNDKADSTQFSPANKGLSHTYFFNQKTFIKTTLATTYESNYGKRDSIQNDKSLKRTGGFGYNNSKWVLQSFVNKKFSAQHSLQTGIVIEASDYTTKDSLLLYKPITGTAFWGFNNDFNGNTTLLQAYTQWKYKINDLTTLYAGIHAQYLTLNKRFAIEPRVAINYKVKDNQTLSFGYGLHNQVQPYAMYFYRNKNAVTNIETNNDLGYTRSNHFILGYDISFNQHFRLKAETYYQYIDNIPVEKMSSSYSVLNYGATFANTYKDNLVNQGKGQNYGVELTLEKFFSNSYYFLFTTSVYKSTYQGSDGIKRNTAFAGNYVVNGLGGYEFKLKRNLRFLIDAKLTVAGGLRYSPIDIAASIVNKEATYKDSEAFALQNKTYFKPDIKFTIRKDFNKRIALEWALDIQNIANYKNVFLNWYDKNTQRENIVYQNGRFPTVQLKLEF
jgi:Carboxypeptidase regulatory-like domain